MSGFSAVDGAADPQFLVAYLDATARTGSRMKQYAAVAHALRRPDGLVLDLGCGAGHDLVLLASVGLRPLGVDPSAVMLGAASRRTAGGRSLLVRAVGETLPFRDGSLGGCRIERVLQHVLDPSAVLGEAVRCLRHGGLITVYEPDWDSFRVAGDLGEKIVGWLNGARHPGVGGLLWSLVEEAGCEVLDRVEELSVWRSLAVLDRVIGLEASIARAVGAGRISEEEADRWVAAQRERDARGEFRSTIPKVLVVARKVNDNERFERG